MIDIALNTGLSFPAPPEAKKHLARPAFAANIATHFPKASMWCPSRLPNPVILALFKVKQRW